MPSGVFAFILNESMAITETVVKRGPGALYGSELCGENQEFADTTIEARPNQGVIALNRYAFTFLSGYTIPSKTAPNKNEKATY